MYGGLITFFFAFLVTGFFTYLEGSLFGDDSNTVYFLTDTHNLLLYTIVVPAYVGFGSALLAAIVVGADELKRHADEISSAPTATHRIPLPVAIVLILLIALAGTSQYISDVLDPANVKEIYWFVGYSEQKGRSVSFVTIYYALLNFSFLFLTMVFIAGFFSSFTYVIDVAAALSKPDDNVSLEFETLETKLKTFVTVYVCAKALVVCYMLNFYIWAASPLRTTENLLVAQIAITVIGVFVVSGPRYVVEYEWHLYKWRSGRFSAEAMRHDDLRSVWVRFWVWILDGLLIGGFITGVWIIPRLMAVL